MGVPCSPRAGLERDAGARRACRIVRLEQRLDAYGPRKVCGWSLPGGLRPASRDDDGLRISSYRFISFVAVFFILLFTFDYKGFGIGDGKTRLENYCIILQKLRVWREAKRQRGS
jgi:hypothetical protein